MTPPRDLPRQVAADAEKAERWQSILAEGSWYPDPWTRRGGGPDRDLIGKDCAMCRNIRPLFNFDPVATDEEIQAAALQFVRKISGFSKPAKANEAAFAAAVEEIAATSRRLLDALEANAAPKNREIEAEKAKARSALRFAR